MANYAIYVTSTGEIDRIIGADSQSDADSNTEAGESNITVADGEDDTTSYISGGVVTDKADPTISWDVTSIVGNGSDAATASSIPNPATIEFVVNNVVGGQFTSIADLTVTDGTLVLRSFGVGKVTVQIDSGFTFLLHEQEITLT